MGEKKKPGRFTLQFNMEDPQQRTVSELLEQQGRHKAQFLTSAVLCYQHPKPHERSGEPAAIDETTLERMLLSIMEKHPQLTATLPSVRSESKGTQTLAAPATEPWDNSMGEDAKKAISETLAAFRQE